MTSPQPWSGVKLPLGQLIVSTAEKYYWIISNQFDHPNPTNYYAMSCVGHKESIVSAEEIKRHFLICPIYKPLYQGVPVIGEMWAPIVPWRNEILRIERVPAAGDITASVIDTTNNKDRFLYAPIQYYHPTYFLTFYRPLLEAKEMNFGC